MIIIITKAIKKAMKLAYYGCCKIILYLKETFCSNTDQSINTGTGKVFVFASPGTPWGYMFQRPQQLATSLSRLGNTVYYDVEGNFWFKPDNKVIGKKQISPGLFLYDDFERGNRIRESKEIIIWRYWASQYDYMDNVKDGNIFNIYDWLDETIVHCYNEVDNMNHEELLKESDLVIVTSKSLYKKAKEIRDDVLLVPNGCDYEFFSYPKYQAWPELDELRKESEVIIGYYGAIAEWFDFDLLIECAENYPTWTFLIVGPVYENIQFEQKMQECSNIKVWGRVDYNKLPYLLSKFDIAFIPFKLNEITNSTSPVKLFEYMAGGKPVVTTAMQEIRDLENILIADNSQHFALQLERALELSKNEHYCNNLKEEAKLHSWDNRVKIVLSELHKRGIMP